MTRPLAPLLALALSLTACGATQSTAILTDTEELLESARNSGAGDRAPYELHAAELYLTGSREHMGRGEYDAALQLASRARALAKAAREKALSAGLPGGAAGDAPSIPDGPMAEGAVTPSGSGPAEADHP